jgi:hypothetical protein
MANGLSESEAQSLAIMDLVIADGAEDRVTTLVEQVTGSEPVSFDRFVTENVAVWWPTTKDDTAARL